MRPKYTVLPAQRAHHPDFPNSGWSVTVLDYTQSKLVLRVYGTSKRQVENRVRALGLSEVVT